MVLFSQNLLVGYFLLLIGDRTNGQDTLSADTGQNSYFEIPLKSQRIDG